MSRLTVALLIILIVIPSILTVWLYSEKQRLATEVDSQKRQLDAQAAQLRTVEDEKHNLETQLAETQNKLAELNAKITELEANITDLRRQLAIRGMIGLGLTFLWNPALSNMIDRHYLETLVIMTNQIWEPAGIHYFIYQAQSDPQTPTNLMCAEGGSLGQWAQYARSLFAQAPDIPVAIVKTLNFPVVGCGLIGKTGVAISLTSDSIARTLSHELIHNFGADDTMITYETYRIPESLYALVQSAAKQYQMSIPSS